jgi:hypothetical protein
MKLAKVEKLTFSVQSKLPDQTKITYSDFWHQTLPLRTGTKKSCLFVPIQDLSRPFGLLNLPTSPVFEFPAVVYCARPQTLESETLFALQRQPLHGAERSRRPRRPRRQRFWKSSTCLLLCPRRRLPAREGLLFNITAPTTK